MNQKRGAKGASFLSGHYEAGRVPRPHLPPADPPAASIQLTARGQGNEPDRFKF